MSNLYRLIRYLRPYGPRLGGAVAAMLGVAAATVAVANLMRPIFDQALQDDVTQEYLFKLAGNVVLLYLGLGVSRFLSSYLMGSVGYSVVCDLRVDLYRRLQFLPLGFHERRTTGGLMSRVTSDVQAVQEALTRVLVDVVRDGFTLIGLVGFMFWRDWRLALVTLTIAPLLISIITRMSKGLRRASQGAQQGLGEVSALLQETLTGIRVVKAFGMERAEVEKFRRAAEKLYRHSVRAQRLDSLGSPIMEFLGAVAGAAVLVYGSLQIGAGVLTPGDFFSFLIAAFWTYQPLRRLSSANSRVQAAAAAADRLFEIFDTPIEPGYASATAGTTVVKPMMEALGDRVPMPPIVEGLRFEDVSFAYRDSPAEANVLHSVNLTIPAGSAVALVGQSGAGKTTVANLIPRFYEPTSGCVRVDGVELSQISLEELRAQIAMVTQETILFNDTVRNNIAYCQPEVTLASVQRAAEAAFAHEFVKSLPEGYDTVLGESGLRLSGGQRQRIAIARALLKNAPILILDEATSNLDARSDRLVQEALVHLLRGRTTLIIAHRLSTVRRAHSIVVLDSGRVVETGTHHELLENRGEYQRLYAMHFVEPSGAGLSAES